MNARDPKVVAAWRARSRRMGIAALVGAGGVALAAVGVVNADADAILGVSPLAWFLSGGAGFGFACWFQDTYRCPRCDAFVGSRGPWGGLTLWPSECPGCRTPLR